MSIEQRPFLNNSEQIDSGPLGSPSQSFMNEYDSVSMIESLHPESTSFNELLQYMEISTAEDGRDHIDGFNINLLSIALEGTDASEQDIEEMYKNIHPHWENLQNVDSPTTVESMQAREENEKTEDPDIKFRLYVLDELGKDSGMAAHAERTAYNGALFTALYIVSQENALDEKYTAMKQEAFTAEKIEEILKNHKFTREELQLIALGGLSGLLHDLGKAQQLDDGSWKYQDILLSIQKRTDEQVKRMGEHSADGAKLISEAKLPKVVSTVAEKHHTKNFTPSTTSLKEDPTKFMVALITWLDQFDAAVSIRTYKFETPIYKMHDDIYIHDQQEEYADDDAKIAYHQFVTVSAMRAGDKLEAIKNRAREKMIAKNLLLPVTTL